MSVAYLSVGCVCRYLCKLSDQELRQSAARNMADLMWSTVKEPLDSALCFDKESLDLAFKYFMSPTLTMRLAGLSQITVSQTPNGFNSFSHPHVGLADSSFLWTFCQNETLHKNI